MRSSLAEEMVRGALAAFGGAHGCVVSVRGRLTCHRATGSVRAICGLGQLRHSSSARGERRSEMNKRLSFLLVLSATALAWSGCDNNGPTDGGSRVHRRIESASLTRGAAATTLQLQIRDSPTPR